MIKKSYDIVIIGGGINGCGLAADAALRGLKVLLIEADDLASKTSSASSQLIHGGLRYLEQYDFALVRKSLQERKTLLKVAKHLVRPLPIVLPYHNHRRNNWWLRLGLFVYDHLVWSTGLPVSQTLSTKKDTDDLLTPLHSKIQDGYLFYDCKTDDARLTITNALQAKRHGAEVLTHTRLLEGKASNSQWTLTLQSATSTYTVNTTAVINAAGPWVNQVNHCLSIAAPRSLTLVKGSHIVVKKWYSGQQAYLLQQSDNRIVFVVPYCDNFVFIGTTEITLKNIPQNLSISPEEIDYLLQSVTPYFKQSLTTADIIHSWSGIRPLAAQDHTDLHHNPSILPRGYVIHQANHPAPALLIYGGKITTYRQLAEESIDCLQPLFPDLPRSHTASTPLPGSDLPDKISWENYQKHIQERFAWLEMPTLQRLLNQYGTRVEWLLRDCATVNDLGFHFGQGLYEKEVLYLYHQEWATTAEDILWRRTHLGLFLSETEKTLLASYLGKLSAQP